MLMRTPHRWIRHRDQREDGGARQPRDRACALGLCQRTPLHAAQRRSFGAVSRCVGHSREGAGRTAPVNGLDGAGKFGQHTIASCSHHTSAVLFDKRGNQLAMGRLQAGNCALLVETDKTRVAGHISGKNGCEPTLCSGMKHCELRRGVPMGHANEHTGSPRVLGRPVHPAPATEARAGFACCLHVSRV